MKFINLKSMMIVFFVFCSMQARGEVKPLPPGEYQCQVEIIVLEDFNGEPNIGDLFDKTFGGQNTLTVLKAENGIRYAKIANKNGADDLQILIMWNYVKDIWTFVGASLVGPVKGYLNCP